MRDEIDPMKIELLETLKRAIKWLRRIEKDYPDALNNDSISKHLDPTVTKAELEIIRIKS